MILLETGNRVVDDILRPVLIGGERAHFFAEFADFDGVRCSLNCSDAEKNVITYALSFNRYAEFKAAGAHEALEAAFPGMVSAPQEGFDVTLSFQVDQVPSDKEGFLTKLKNVKTLVLGTPIRKVLSGSVARDPVTVNYRHEEPLYVLKSSSDQATVIFMIRFHDPDDVTIAKVFMQEFADTCPRVQNSPSVSYSKVPPGELKALNVAEGESIGFVSMVLFKRQLEASQIENTVANLLLFRDYLHYHIKCSKAYMHSRMRTRVETLLKVLNRAKQESETKEKKTASGRSFVRK
eukprot:TRINITY_DN15891_c0_g1_i1.p1 TRINITY_DN15891_c0_g1~~TRINITY_DN15891_c0_g1_i1.p1  ORF type:complete len:293 (-),score=67.41 TRINITY_DN15891_c0_g1_i1:255-1133(-)